MELGVGGLVLLIAWLLALRVEGFLAVDLDVVRRRGFAAAGVTAGAEKLKFATCGVEADEVVVERAGRGKAGFGCTGGGARLYSFQLDGRQALATATLAISFFRTGQVSLYAVWGPLQAAHFLVESLEGHSLDSCAPEQYPQVWLMRH